MLVKSSRGNRALMLQMLWMVLTSTMPMTIFTLTEYCSAQAEAPPAAEAAPGTEPPPAGEPLWPPLDDEEPASLETGLPLRALTSPLRWGQLSLLSFTAYQGLDTAPRFQPALRNSELTSLSFLAIYSKPFAGWQLELQYQPFLWIAAGQPYQDLTGSSAGLHTTRRLNQQWTWRFKELARFTPGQQSTLPKSYVADFGAGNATGNPLLSSGRDSFNAEGSTQFTDVYSAQSHLTFTIDQSYYYLLGTRTSSDLELPSQTVASYGASIGWEHQVGARDTFNVRYDYTRQSATNTTVGSTDFHTAELGWGHVLTPGLRFSVSAGPGWSSYANRTTLQGSAQLAKEFHRGSVELSFARTDSFSGVVSSYFNNRYDLKLTRHLTTRWQTMAAASYVQQHVSPGRETYGKFASIDLSYFLNRNWSVFSTARYLDVIGNSSFYAPEKIISAGVRWAWEPDKE